MAVLRAGGGGMDDDAWAGIMIVSLKLSLHSLRAGWLVAGDDGMFSKAQGFVVTRQHSSASGGDHSRSSNSLPATFCATKSSVFIFILNSDHLLPTPDFALHDRVARQQAASRSS